MKLTILLLLLALILVACTSKRTDQEKGGSGAATQSSKSSGKHDPCSLVTKEEMSLATGEQFIKAKAEDNSNSCTYTSADASVASAEITSSWDGIESRAMMPIGKTAADLTKITPGNGETKISGLGDEANFAMYALTVRKGNAAFMIRLNLPSRLSQSMRQEGGKGPQIYADDILAIDKVLAEKALTRL